MTAAQPLAGLNIVVTRPREQAAELSRRIEHLGGKALSFPLLEIAAVPDEQSLRKRLSQLDQTDLIIFISPNAVRYGVAAMGAIGDLPPALQVAAVGQGSAKALRSLGFDRIIAPTERFDSEGLLALPELQNMTGKHVLILRGDGGRELLGDTLRARGAQVEYVTCYLRSKPSLQANELLAAAPDMVTVTSSEAMAHLWEALADQDKERIAAIPLFVPHERIAGIARQQGWRQVIATGAGDDGLLTGLIAWANAQGKTTP